VHRAVHCECQGARWNAHDTNFGYLRWTREIGQEVKLGLLLRRMDLNDGQTEAVFGGFQGEGCS
jgi:hypothetical protein